MFRRPLVLTLAMICCAVASAQQPNPQCPTISINGPADITATGETAEFSVDLKGLDTSRLRFEWQADFGNIERGQGTPAITVRRTSPQGSGTRVTLEVKGLSEGCPNTFTEIFPDEAPPPPTELEIFTLPLGSIEPERFRSIVDAARNHPNDQILIFVPPDQKTQQAFAHMLSESPLKKLLDDQRVTYVVNKTKNSPITVWLAPPGSKMPMCDGCETVESCPAISVVGPAGIIKPGEIAAYTAIVSDPTLKGLEYDWEVSIGTIVSERGASSIKVQMPTDQNDVNAVATVTVKGLPASCPNRVSESAVVSLGWHPFALDQYGQLPRSWEKARLANVSNELAKDPNMVAFIVLQVPKKLGRAAYNTRVKTITTLFRSLRVSKDKYVFVDAGDGDLSTTIYLMPPSAVPDSWKAGKIL